MENLKTADSTYLLEEGLEMLHQESHNWISEMELWKIELDFFQKLLDTHSYKLNTTDEKKEMDHFQNLIIYYNGELIDSIKKKAKKHNKTLATDLENPVQLNEAQYIDEHRSIAAEIDALRMQFHEYKKEFFEFIGPVI